MKIFMSFMKGNKKQQICYRFILLYCYGGPVLSPCINFPNFDGPNAFPKIQQAPGSNFRTVGKFTRKRITKVPSCFLATRPLYKTCKLKTMTNNLVPDEMPYGINVL